MEEIKKNPTEKKEIGENYYLNKNCWLVRNLKYAPYKRCKYCEFKFHECLFLKFQVISFVLIILSFSLFFILEKRLSILAIVTVFSFVVVYGYFFNQSTEKIIRSNFSLKKAKIILKGLTDNLENKVKEQTNDILEKNKNLVKQACQLEKDKKDLMDLDRMKDEFLQMATHELNTPITVIKGKLNMAIDEDMCHLNDEQKDFLRPVLNDTERLSRLSRDILDTARIDQNRLKINAVEGDLDNLINQLVSGFAVNAKERNNSVNYIPVTRPLPKITFDQTKISEVINNLLTNANKFTENGKIVVSAKVQDKYIIISVTDTGIGISKEDQNNLFHKFYQAGRFDPENPQEQQGTGLGLYISRSIIQLHGGKMWLESSQGKGSTFYFSLPLEYHEVVMPSKLHIEAEKLRVL